MSESNRDDYSPEGEYPEETWLLNMRIIALLNQLQGIMRPSAFNDLKKYLFPEDSEDTQPNRKELTEFLEWGMYIIKTHYPFEGDHYPEFEVPEELAQRSERYLRTPHNAFRLRWMHLPPTWKFLKILFLERWIGFTIIIGLIIFATIALIFGGQTPVPILAS